MVSALVSSFAKALSFTGRGGPVGLHYCWAFCTDSSVGMSVLMAFSSLFWFLFCGERSMRFSLQYR